MLELVKKFCEEKNIEISKRQLEQLQEYCSFLAEKNKVMNLTAITEPREMEIKHLIDSLEGLPVLKELWTEGSDKPENFSLIDIGCGAGLPGIPLKIMLPYASFTLLDSLHKRIGFVNETIERLGLNNISGVAARAEEFADEDHRETFDFCVSRAVAEANTLLEYCLPFVKPGGFCLLYKAENCDEEIDKAKNAISILGGELAEIRTMTLPEEAGRRSLVIIRKISPTPPKYPRRPGKPSKSPL